ncbi:MAG: restriction endonuclease [Candidatus Thorarchaeota archaeon]
MSLTDWHNHPLFREVVSYATRNEDPPPEVLRRARIEFPDSVYARLMYEAGTIRIGLIETETRSRKLQEVKKKYKSLEQALEAADHYGRTQGRIIVYTILSIAIVIGIGLVTPQMLFLGVLFAFIILWLVTLVYIFRAQDKEREIRSVVDDWRRERFEEEERAGISEYYGSVRYRQHLYSLSPREFEAEVTNILRENGYQVQLTEYVSDYGIDAIARKDGNTYVVQIKRFAESNLIGRPDLQKLQGAMLHQRADGMIFITLGYFSKPAQEYGKKQGIMLIDGLYLVEMAKRSMTKRNG